MQGDRQTRGIDMARMEVGELGAAAIAPANSAELFFELGLKYCLGKGVERDYVAAHKWFNLAALKGNSAARDYRSELSREMDAAQIAEAQRQARDWLTIH
jgi:TPR repeat protein